ncbi:hypothetical protein [Oribacterium sinus]|jgi:hypothetical protein
MGKRGDFCIIKWFPYRVLRKFSSLSYGVIRKKKRIKMQNKRDIGLEIVNLKSLEGVRNGRTKRKTEQKKGEE